MSKELRKQIDRVKNWKQFLNENSIDAYTKEIKKILDETPILNQEMLILKK
jgi:hypothetical protein